MYYFLKEDLDELNAQIEELAKKVYEVGQEVGESCKVSSETWHDNPAFDSTQRQQEMLSKRWHELKMIKSKAQLFIPPANDRNDRVKLGRTVTIQDEDTGETQTFKISSYMVLKEQNAVSYVAPLAQIIIGAKIGETRTGIILEKEKSFRILKIE